MIVFVTGPIGAGKSKIVFELSRTLNWPYVSIDDVVQEGYGDAWINMKLKKAFGTNDRHEIARMVFSDEDKLDVLEDIFAGYIERTVEVILDSNPNVIFEFPTLLNDVQLEKYNMFVDDDVDVVVYVDADEKVRFNRVSVRPGMTLQKFEAVNKLQRVMATNKDYANIIVENNGDEFVSDLAKRIIEEQIK